MQLTHWVALGVFTVTSFLALGVLVATGAGWHRFAGGMRGWLVRLLPRKERLTGWERYCRLAERLAGFYLLRRNLPARLELRSRVAQGLLVTAPVFVPLAALLALVGSPAAAPALLLMPACWEVVGRMTRWQQRRRRRQLLAELPGFLERITVGLSAGISLEEGIRLAARGTRGPLQVGLARSQRLLDGGYGLVDALDELAHATDPQLLKPLVERLTQAEKLGRPLAETLQTLAMEWRRRRREEVEEQLNRLPIQLALVGIIFIFPAVVVVVLVPNLLLFWGEGW